MAGPIFSLDLFGQHVVVLNTYKTAADFFGRIIEFFPGKNDLHAPCFKD